jgi:hypothetical protein
VIPFALEIGFGLFRLRSIYSRWSKVSFLSLFMGIALSITAFSSSCPGVQEEFIKQN